MRGAAVNLRRLGPALLARWDARRLPLPPASADRILCNPPFGKQLAAEEDLGELYAGLVAEADRVLRPGGRAVFLVSAAGPLSRASDPE